MTSYDVEERTGGGYQKLTPESGDGSPIYKGPDGKFTSQQAFAASKGQEQRAVIRDRETGQIKKRIPKSDAVEVEGEVQEVKDGFGFSIDPETGDPLDRARSVMKENPEKWDAFQVMVEAEFSCAGSPAEKGTVTGWSPVKNEIRPVEIRHPVTGVGEDGSPEVIAWETIDADTLDESRQQAEEHAWSKITCSPGHFRIIDTQVKLYTSQQSLWAQQAREQTHLEL